ncbi:MAG: hypothetical protein ACFUZC_16890 [Chthoniobacteraceae bacterium]
MALPSKVKSGDPIKASDWNALIDCVRSAQISPGSGVRITRTPSGTTLAVDTVPSRRLSLPLSPFQVIQGPALGKEPQIGVIANSHVINLSDKDSHEEDNSDWGLLSDDAADDDENWFVCPSVGSKIWLQFKLDADGNLLESSIEYGQVGGDQWDEFPDPVSINVDDPANPWQEFYHLLIAEITDPEQDPRDGFQVTFSNGDKAQVTQILKTNVALVDATTTEDADESNLPIMVAIPWTQPGTAMDGSADEINADADVKTPWSFAGSVDDDFPFKLRGRVDDEGQGWITVTYGEVNEVAPTLYDGSQMGEDDAPYAMKADDGGVVYIKIIIDQDAREVESFTIGMESDEESIPDDGEDDNGDECVYFVLGRFYIDESQQNDEGETIPLPVPTNYIREHIGMTEYTVRRNGSWASDWFRTFTREPLSAVDALFPFELGGYVDDDGQGWITVAYGEVNGIAPDGMAQGDDPYEMKADDDGVVFVTVTLDADTREVISFCFDMATDEESIDDDDEETMHVVLGRFYIDTDADENGLPVPFNTVVGNINMSVEPVVNADGRLCLDMVHTYLRDAVPTGFYNMEVFDTDEDGTPVDGCSSMFLSVGDTDDPSNDGLTFQANDNYLEIVWGADQDAEYPIPAIKFTDADGNVSKIDTGGLSFWDDDGSEDNPEVDLSMDGLSQWDMDGNGTLHDAGGISFWDGDGTKDNPEIDLSLDGLSQWDMDGNGSRLDAGGLSLWDGDANKDNPQVDLSLDGLKIWDMDGDGMKIDTTSLIFWDSSTSEDDPKFELDPDQLHFKDEDGNEANYDAGGITFDDTDGSHSNLDAGGLDITDSEGNTSNLDATNVTFTDSDGDSSTLDGGGLTFTSGSDTTNLDATGLTIGENTALTDGDLDLGDDGTIEIGDSGSITVGDSVLSDGDLDLGSSGSIETADIDASGTITCDQLDASNADLDSLDVSGGANFESSVDVAGNLDAASISSDSITYGGSELDAYIDDSIRTALDSLSASIDCDSMTVTFSYSY